MSIVTIVIQSPHFIIQSEAKNLVDINVDVFEILRFALDDNQSY